MNIENSLDNLKGISFLFKQMGLSFKLSMLYMEKLQELEKWKITYGIERFQKAKRLSIITEHSIDYWICFDVDVLNKKLEECDI